MLILDDAGIIIEDSLIVNDTSNSQEIATAAGELHLRRVNITLLTR